MRTILAALILGISTAAVALPALAAESERELGGSEQIVAAPDRDTPQIGVSVAAGSDQPAEPERYENH